MAAGSRYHGTSEATVRLSEVLSALSFILDGVEGQSEGHAVRSCFIGMTIAARLGLSEEQRAALFYALLLKDAGCSSNASRISALFDADDSRVKKTLKQIDRNRLSEAIPYVARTVSPEGSGLTRAGRFFAVVLEGRKATRDLVQIRCERGAEISRFLGFPEETARAIRSLDEHWDGTGYPDGLLGEEIPLLARICGLAQTVDVFHAAHGPAKAGEVARARRGEWFDPVFVDVFLAEARVGRVWERMEGPDLASSVSRMEPGDRILTATPERLELVARAFARIIDAKSPFTYRHSEGVARVAEKMTAYMGLPGSVTRDQRWAGLLHDIGKLGVSSRILDKPGRLTDAEFAQIKEHPRLTYKVLSKVTPFRHLAEVAANHHERLDGSGYHRGISGDDLGLPDRILAVADVYDALSQDRPYRQAMPNERALAILKEESGARLSAECVEAVEALASKDELSS